MSGFFSANKQKATDAKGVTSRQKTASGHPGSEEGDPAKGVGGEDIYETAPSRNNTPGEYVINNQNAWITLGYDRNGSFLSGKGGEGALNSSAIEITCGMMANTKEGPDGEYAANPNWGGDAAKIYISQRSNIDEYMQMPYDKDTTTYDFKDRSAIGMQADHIRIAGREGIKIVTGAPEHFKGVGFFGIPNSLGGKRYIASGIELIANYQDGSEKIIDLGNFPPVVENDNIHPMVRGVNLIGALDDIVKQMINAFETIGLFCAAQIELNGALGAHTHPVVSAPIGGGLAAPSPELAVASIKNMVDEMSNTMLPAFKYSVNCGLNFRWNYLYDYSPYYICSRYNFTN
tara:strand:- start:18700 stop:19737 length:1038 start_codon:yes stop_codon:yes gene_type:complete